MTCALSKGNRRFVRKHRRGCDGEVSIAAGDTRIGYAEHIVVFHEPDGQASPRRKWRTRVSAVTTACSCRLGSRRPTARHDRVHSGQHLARAASAQMVGLAQAHGRDQCQQQGNTKRGERSVGRSAPRPHEAIVTIGRLVKRQAAIMGYADKSKRSPTLSQKLPRRRAAASAILRARLRTAWATGSIPVAPTILVLGLDPRNLARIRPLPSTLWRRGRRPSCWP